MSWGNYTLCRQSTKEESKLWKKRHRVVAGKPSRDGGMVLLCFVLRQEKGNIVSIAGGRARADLGVIWEGTGGWCSDGEGEDREKHTIEWETFKKHWVKKRKQEMNLNLPFGSFLLEETTQILDREAETEGSKEKVTCGKKAGKGNGHHTSPQEGRTGGWGRNALGKKWAWPSPTQVKTEGKASCYWCLSSHITVSMANCPPCCLFLNLCWETLFQKSIFFLEYQSWLRLGSVNAMWPTVAHLYFVVHWLVCYRKKNLLAHCCNAWFLELSDDSTSIQL